VVLPRGTRATVSAIETFDGELDEGAAPMSSTCACGGRRRVARRPRVPRQQPARGRVRARRDGLLDVPAAAGRGDRRFAVKHTTRTVKAVASEIVYRVDVNTLHCEESATESRLNDIGRVRLRLAAPLAVDAYRRNRSTGSFILIDEATNETSGAEMVLQRTGAQVLV
jgi:bifunctional enzyme CysN/CysC